MNVEVPITQHQLSVMAQMLKVLIESDFIDQRVANLVVESLCRDYELSPIYLW